MFRVEYDPASSHYWVWYRGEKAAVCGTLGMVFEFLRARSDKGQRWLAAVPSVKGK